MCEPNRTECDGVKHMAESEYVPTRLCKMRVCGPTPTPMPIVMLWWMLERNYVYVRGILIATNPRNVWKRMRIPPFCGARVHRRVVW